MIRARFAAARLSYAKVRALTRIATPQNEAGLAEIAGPMTGNQLERFARAHRQATQADDAAARIRRRLTWRFEEDGSLSGTFRLPPLQGAVLLKALRAACADLAGPGGDVSAETPAAAETPAVRTSSDLTDGLVAVAESFLAAKVAGADDPEVYQVVVHVGTDALAGGPAPATEPAGVSAETPPPVPGDPADPARCHVEDGPAVSVSTAQMLGCTLLPPSPPLPEPDGSIDVAHDADITPETIIPPWYGERLDLDHAIYVCVANARTREEREQHQDGDPANRGRVTVYEPEDWPERIRQYEVRTPRRFAPALVPTPV